MNFARRPVTISRPIVTEALWIEILTFLHDICTLVQTYNVPDELTINVDQTPFKICANFQYHRGRKKSQACAEVLSH